MAQPRPQLLKHVTGLASHLPGVLDGRADSVREARIAVRRIRELLPLAGLSDANGGPELEQSVRRAGRALNKVRELDVHLELLSKLEERLPGAAAALAAVRRDIDRQRATRARAMVKTIERVDLPGRLSAQIAGARSAAGDRSGVRRRLRRIQIRSMVQYRARRAADAIDYASGIYFPNRLHSARMALKKLRYALEIAADAGRWRGHAGDLRELRKAQQVLGELHDRQALVDVLERFEMREDGAPFDAELSVVIGLLDAECGERHHHYLAGRARLLAICAEHARPRRSHISKVLSFGAVAASVGLATRRLAIARASAPAPIGPERQPVTADDEQKAGDRQKLMKEAETEVEV